MNRGFLKPSLEDTCRGIERYGLCDGALAAAVEEGNLALTLWLLGSQTLGRRSLDEALSAAARHRADDHRFADALLAHGASASTRDRDGRTPIHLCCGSRAAGAPRTLRSLLHSPSLTKAALTGADADGHRPGDACARLESFEAVEVATAWSEVFGGRRTSFLAPHLVAAAAAALERSSSPAPSAIAVVLCACLFARRRAWAALVASPRSLLGSGVASAACVWVAVASSAALPSLNRGKDADALAACHRAVYAAYVLAYLRCLAPPPRAPRTAALAALARGAPRVVDGLCGACLVERRRADDWTHCLRCGTCVPGRDHHCVLLDRCVHAGNRGAFVGLLALTLGAGFSSARVGAWAVGGACGGGGSEAAAWATLSRASIVRCEAARAPSALLLVVAVPLGCVRVAYELARQALFYAGVEAATFETKAT